MKSLIVLPQDTTADNSTLNHSVRWLRQVLPQPVDVLHADKRDDMRHKEYAQVVYLGRADQLRKILGADACIPQLKGDAYWCRTISADPPVICLGAGNDRGVQYAAGEFCRSIRLGRDLSALDIVREPQVPLRMAYMCASTNVGKHFRPRLFDDSIEKLAYFGANGVLMVPEKEYGTSVGMEGLPFHFRDKKVVSVEARVREWRSMLDQIQSYGHEIFLLISAWIPPDLEIQQVRDYYDGKIDIPDYKERAADTMKAMLTVMFEQLPQISGVALHSLERSVLWGGSVSMFPTEDLERTAGIMETYLNAVKDCCESFEKTPCFWPHAFGVDGRQVIGLRKILEKFPEIINLEDSYWNNSGWPFLPVMGYLPDDLRENIHLQNRFGLFTTSTDAEYYGSGQLPALLPEQLYDASLEAVKRKADVLIFRLHRWDQTSHGTLDNICGVNVEAAVRSLWSPVPDMTEIWDEWSRLRFGKAADAVTEALQKSRDILLKGIICKNFKFMTHGSIPAHQWTPEKKNFTIFSKPGVPFIQKDYQDLKGEEFQNWQAGVETIPIEDFRSDQREALQAAVDGRELIQKEKENLSRDDYAYLTGIYDDVDVMLKAIRLTGELVYAANLVVDNYDNHPDTVALVEGAVGCLEEYAQTVHHEKGTDYFCAPYYMKIRLNGKQIEAPSLGESLLSIAEMYRTWLADKTA